MGHWMCEGHEDRMPFTVRLRHPLDNRCLKGIKTELVRRKATAGHGLWLLLLGHYLDGVARAQMHPTDQSV